MTGNRYPLVTQRVRTQGQKPVAIDDPAVRGQFLALASTGMSRRGVAARMGVNSATLLGWLERGRAEPDKEPYGSFSTQYLTSERGLEEAASSAVAMRVQQIVERMREVLAFKGHPEDRPQPPSPADFDWLLRVQQSRWPDDHGTSAHHRIPEPEPSGEAWLERTGMNHAQLVHMLRKPPEPVAEALVEAADDVYQLLLASGWQPKESSQG